MGCEYLVCLLAVLVTLYFPCYFVLQVKTSKKMLTLLINIVLLKVALSRLCRGYEPTINVWFVALDITV